jgi:hypothetical protein
MKDALTERRVVFITTQVRPNEPTAEGAGYMASETGRIPRGT